MNKKDFNKTTIIFFIVAFVLVSLFAAIVLSVSDKDINTSSSNSDGWIYDDKGYLLSYSDVWHTFEGKITIYEYDKRGNLIKKELSYTDEDFLREKYLMEYNNLNQLIKQEEYRYNYGTNLLNLEYRYFYEYDKYGNLIKKICYDSNGVERVKDEFKWELVRLPKGFIDFLEMNADKDTIKTPSK